jgi:hypothetical protein
MPKLSKKWQNLFFHTFLINRNRPTLKIIVPLQTLNFNKKLFGSEFH